MIVYKYFMKIALRHKFVIMGYSIIFLFLSILNGTNTENDELLFTETKLDIGIIDNMNSELSRNLVGYLTSKNNIVDTLEDEDYIKEQIFLQAVDGVIIIPNDFDKKVINKERAIQIYNSDREIGSSYLQQQVEKYLIFANASYDNGKFDLKNLNTALSQKADLEMIDTNKNLKNTGVTTWFKYYYNFVSYIIIAVYIAVIGLIMAEFKDEKIENRMNISSKQFLKYNRDIYLGQISLAAIITSIFILGSILLKGKYIGQVNLGKYVINTIVFSFAILCLTFLINNLTRNRFIINGISTVASLGISFISGVMVPQEFLGERVLSIAKFFPTYYFVQINERSINSLMDVKYEIFIQIIFGLTFLLLGLYFSKSKQKA